MRFSVTKGNRYANSFLGFTEEIFFDSKTQATFEAKESLAKRKKYLL